MNNTEDEIINVGQRWTEEAYEQYSNGEISAEQLRYFYTLLATWTQQTEGILNLITRKCYEERYKTH